MSEDVLLKVDGASKKFCRDLKRSMLYGIMDSVGDMSGREAQRLELRSQEFWAVNDVSFELKRGECIGLVGHNGAGKTTLLRMLSGLIKPDRGRIEVRGRMGALIALGAGFNPLLTGRENVYVNGAILGLNKREIDAKYDEIVDFADIGEFINAPVQNYSSGMQVRLGFAVAIAVRPDILLLDEVLAVGDANFQAKCFNVLADFREQGTSFILVSHNNHTIARYCQQVLYMRRGSVIYLGDVEEGLSQLNEEMANKGARHDNEGPDWGTPRGSGKVWLSSGKFLDSNGQETASLPVGAPVTLKLEYEKSDLAINNVRLDVLIRDGDDVLFQGDNCAVNQNLILSHDRGHFVVHFEYIPRNTSYLDFSIALLNPKSSEVYDWKQNFRLQIERRPLNQGSLYIPTGWSVEASG